MPEIGEIKRGREIGKKSGRNGVGKYIWHACSTCSRERWVQRIRGEPVSLICFYCSNKLKRERRCGSASPFWKGGRIKNKPGYFLIKLQPDDFFYSMTEKTGYVLEHRLVVAKALGRCLQPWEFVHHKEGFAKDDNRYPETLQLVMEGQHNQLTIFENKMDRLLKMQEELKREIRLLRFENKSLRDKV